MKTKTAKNKLHEDKLTKYYQAASKAFNAARKIK